MIETYSFFASCGYRELPGIYFILSEYGYSKDTKGTLYALGYVAAEILGDPRLKHGIEKTVTEIYGRA